MRSPLTVHRAQCLADAALREAHAAREAFVSLAHREASAWLRSEREAGSWDGSLPIDALWAAAVAYASDPTERTRHRLLTAAREAGEGTDTLYVGARRLRQVEARAREAAVEASAAKRAEIEARSTVIRRTA